jgi:enoyl-CoA hydratase
MDWKQEGNYEKIILEKSGYIARITLNSPDTMNTGMQLFDEIFNAVQAIELRDDIKVIIFKGAGKCFSTGAPLNEVGYVYGWEEPKHGEKTTRPSMRRRLLRDRFTFERWQRILLCPKLTITQAHGYLLGNSMDVFLNSDLIVASEDCKFGEVESKLGVAGMTMSPIMVARVGLTHALDLCLTGRMIDGKEAARIGLINFAVPLEKLEDKVNSIARGLSRYPKDGIVLSKTARHNLYNMMGITKQHAFMYTMHSLGTNIHFEDDEFNFFKARRDMGVKDAIHARNKYFEDLDKAGEI